MTSLETKHVEIRPGEFASIIDIDGPVDATFERELRRHLDGLARSGARFVVLDCQHVAYINSTGLGTILKFMDELEGQGGTLILARLSDRALKVIEMLGFAPTLNIVEDESAAVQIISTLPGGTVQ